MMNLFLDHRLADQDLSGWETSINITLSLTKGSLDVCDLDLPAGNFNIECRSQDIDGDLVRRTQNVKAIGFCTYQESNVAIEDITSDLVCKVSLRGKVNAQKHLPFSTAHLIAMDASATRSTLFESFKLAGFFLNVLV
jgi:hypothetical protein